jgi:very-short-patch-repair endonuclease
MKTKICNKCKKELSIIEFHKSIRGKFGVRGECKRCINSKYIHKPKKNYISKDELYYLYIIKKLNCKQIEKKCNISDTTIAIRLKDYGIKKRKIYPMLGKHQTEKAKIEISMHHKGKHHSPDTEFKKGRPNPAKGTGKKYFCEGCGKKISDYRHKRCRKCFGKICSDLFTGRFNPKALTRQKYYCILCGKKITWNTYLCGGKHCHSCDTKLRFKNEEYRNRVIEAQRKGMVIRPNKPEKILSVLLNKDYKYVGDGSFIINGFNPDFINCNGQKKIIELYGDYWHNLPDYKERDKCRIKSYKKYGYKTLIIWEHELKNLRQLNNKLIKF